MVSQIRLWNRRVKAHHAQSIRAQEGQEPSEDFWRPFAAAFHSDPRRTDDPVVNRLLREVQPESTALDVGGGAGRLALPLALQCHHVTVVEPSPSMMDLLQQGAKDANIHNLSIVQATWEEAVAQPASVVLCAHVLYGVQNVEPFVKKLASHATEMVLILMFMDSPQAHLSPVWKRVHGEERVTLPALRELLGVLWEMEIYPDLEVLQTQGPYVYETPEAARGEFRQRLYVRPGTPQEQRLEQAIGELLEKRPNGFVVRGAPLRRLGLLLWPPK